MLSLYILTIVNYANTSSVYSTGARNIPWVVEMAAASEVVDSTSEGAEDGRGHICVKQDSPTSKHST